MVDGDKNECNPGRRLGENGEKGVARGCSGRREGWRMALVDGGIEREHWKSTCRPPVYRLSMVVGPPVRG